MSVCMAFFDRFLVLVIPTHIFEQLAQQFDCLVRVQSLYLLDQHPSFLQNCHHHNPMRYCNWYCRKMLISLLSHIFENIVLEARSLDRYSVHFYSLGKIHVSLICTESNIHKICIVCLFQSIQLYSKFLAWVHFRNSWR